MSGQRKKFFPSNYPQTNSPFSSNNNIIGSNVNSYNIISSNDNGNNIISSDSNSNIYDTHGTFDVNSQIGNLNVINNPHESLLLQAQSQISHGTQLQPLFREPLIFGPFPQNHEIN
ncbi:6198_t:CDS:2 [Entrophospora sp. SA101]|nr:6198_t:CDS:2 [Entrophospora sp. SA101]